MNKRFRLYSGLILGLIAVCWIVFLVSREKDAYLDPEIKDAALTQLNSAKEKVEKTNNAGNTTPAPSPTPQVTDTPEPTQGAEITPSPTPLVFPEYTKFDYIVANVNDSMNVREGAGQDKKVVGTLYADGYGKIIERGSDWFKIKSGNVTGYVSTQFILTDTAAINKIRELNALKVKVTGDDVNIRKEANTACEVKFQAKAGSEYDYYPEFSNALFYAIMSDGELCYVSTSYSEVSIKLKTATK